MTQIPPAKSVTPLFGDNKPPDVGVALSCLLFLPELWIHRRVEAIEFLTSGETRRTVSIDITLEKTFVIEGSDKRMVVPLAFIEKQVLRKLNTCGPDGSSLCVLNRNVNARMSKQMLSSVARGAMPKLSEDELEWLDNKLAEITYAERTNAVAKAKDLQEHFTYWHGELIDAVDLEVFFDVVDSFANGFLLMAELPRTLAGERVLVKFSYESPVEPEPQDGTWRQRSIERLARYVKQREPVTLNFGGPQLWLSGSCHLEVRTPPGVRIEQLIVSETTSDEQWFDPKPADPISRPRHVGHVVCDRTKKFSNGDTFVQFQPDNPSLVTAAVLSAWGAFITFISPLLVWIIGTVYDPSLFPDGISEEAVSLLLLGPAALVAYFGRTPEHPLVAKVLWPLRKSIIITVCLLILGAAALATRIDTPGPNIALWLTLGAAQALNLASVHRIRAKLRRSRYSSGTA